MVYTWKVPGVVPVDAQTAGDELSRICQRDGKIDPKTVVDESRSEGAPLHKCFEWDDTAAAEKYRCSQASHLIRNITILHQSQNRSEATPPIRAFVSTSKPACYEPITVVLSDEKKYLSLLMQAERDMRSFLQKYNVLAQERNIAPVLEAMAVSLEG